MGHRTLKIHLLFLHFGSNAITQQLCFAFNRSAVKLGSLIMPHVVLTTLLSQFHSLQDRDDLMTLLVSLKVEYRLRPETRIGMSQSVVLVYLASVCGTLTVLIIRYHHRSQTGRVMTRRLRIEPRCPSRRWQVPSNERGPRPHRIWWHWEPVDW